MKIGITTPVYVKNQLQYDFLIRSTRSLKSDIHELHYYPVENYIEQVFRAQGYGHLHLSVTGVTAITGRQPQSVAKGWNDGIRRAQQDGCAYVLSINEDVVLRADAIDNLVAFAERCRGVEDDIVMWTMGQYNDLANLDSVELQPENYHEHPNFSAYMVRADFLDVMGNFDENFRPAYMEDNDMHARIAIARKKAVAYSRALFFHFGSRTISTDHEIAVEVGQMSRQCSEYFLRKWGHLIVHEPEDMRRVYYQHPYNNPDKTYRDWDVII